MCLAIAARPGVKIPADSMRGGAAVNRNGGGYAFVRDGVIVINKGKFNVEEMITEYEKDFAENQGSAFIMHFRTTTHGLTNAANTHPFLAGTAGAFVHNGVVQGLGNHTDSDTAEFSHLMAEVKLNELPYVVRALDDHMAGTFNKMAFLGKDNNLFFVNERGGEWNDHIWYSNTGWRRGYGDRGGVSTAPATCPLPNPNKV